MKSSATSSPNGCSSCREADVDFTFTEEQRMMAASVRELLDDVCSPAVIRRAVESHEGLSADRWARYCELGLPGVLAPEAAGGLGLEATDFVLIAEECGRAAMPEPLVEHAGVAVPLLAELATTAHATEVLERAASGALRLGIGHPVNPFLLAGGDCDFVLLMADDEVHLLARSSIGVTVEPSVDASRRLARVEWAPASQTQVAGGVTALAAVERAFQRGALYAAAESLGLAQRMMDLGVAYACERKQFGRQIGSYQGLKHHFASAQVMLEFARPVVYAAATRAGDVDDRAAAAISHAKLAAVAAADACSRIAMQTHGAMGYSWEVDLHFYMKRAWALAGAWGDRSFHSRRVQQLLVSGRLPIGPDQTFVRAGA
jgi:alkylation response protein AidB-like acyl-CoA dehydrogenase